MLKRSKKSWQEPWARTLKDVSEHTSLKFSFKLSTGGEQLIEHGRLFQSLERLLQMHYHPYPLVMIEGQPE